MHKFINSFTQYLSDDLIDAIKRISKFLLIYSICFFILALGIKHAMPFVIAFLLAFILKPIKNKILTINKKFKKFKISEGIVSFVLTILVVVIIGGLLVVLGYQVVEQLKNFYLYITNKEILNSIVNETSTWFLNTFENISEIDPSIATKVSDAANEVVSFISTIIATLVQNLLNLLVSIPTGFLMVLITIIATFFFTKDLDKILQKIKLAFSEKGLNILRKIRKRKNEVFEGYLKAYSLIMIAIAIYSSILYGIAGVPYYIVLAIITALLDALPLFGAGLIYGTLAIIAFFQGDIRQVVILIIGYIGVVVVRQYLEQLLVSSFLGVHPLVIIIALFLALTPVGFVGMFYFLGAFLLYEVINTPKNG